MEDNSDVARGCGVDNGLLCEYTTSMTGSILCYDGIALVHCHVSLKTVTDKTVTDVLQSSLFTIDNDMLYYVDPKQKHQKRVAVPKHLQEKVLRECHAGRMSGHFSGKRTYTSMVRQWWWDGMHASTQRFVRNCSACSIVFGGGKVTRPPLQPIPVQQPFQIVGIDIMDLPRLLMAIVML